MKWTTVIFQVINFLILVWLLKRFLYRPIIAAMEQREQNLAAEWDTARARQLEADKERSTYEQKNKDFEQQRETLLAATRTEAEELKHELTNKARGEVEELRQRWQHSLTEQREAFLQKVKEQVSQGACQVARQVLTEIANTDLDYRVCEIFTRKLEALSPENQEELGTLVRQAEGQVLLRCSSDLSESMRDQLTLAVQQHVPGVQNIEFQTANNLVCGIELLTNSHKLSWTLDSYMDGVEEQLLKTLSKQVGHG